LLNARKVNFEGRAFAYLTVNVNMSAGLLDDATARELTVVSASTKKSSSPFDARAPELRVAAICR
jgi:hypothetical protein